MSPQKGPVATSADTQAATPAAQPDAHEGIEEAMLMFEGYIRIGAPSEANNTINPLLPPAFPPTEESVKFYATVINSFLECVDICLTIRDVGDALHAYNYATIYGYHHTPPVEKFAEAGKGYLRNLDQDRSSTFNPYLEEAREAFNAFDGAGWTMVPDEEFEIYIAACLKQKSFRYATEAFEKAGKAIPVDRFMDIANAATQEGDYDKVRNIYKALGLKLDVLQIAELTRTALSKCDGKDRHAPDNARQFFLNSMTTIMDDMLEEAGNTALQKPNGKESAIGFYSKINEIARKRAILRKLAESCITEDGNVHLCTEALKGIGEGDQNSTLRSLGEGQMKQGKLNVALELYKATNYDEGVLEIAGKFIETQNYRDALDVYIYLGEKDKMVELGNIFFESGKLDLGETAYEVAKVNIPPKYLTHLGDHRFSMGQDGLGEEYYSKAGIQVPSEQYVACADALLRKGRVDDATSIYKRDLHMDDIPAEKLLLAADHFLGFTRRGAHIPVGMTHVDFIGNARRLYAQAVQAGLKAKIKK